MNLGQIVHQQSGGILHWYLWPLFPLFIVYWISAVAETNRAPFDVAEGESEIVAGFHVEYSGVALPIFSSRIRKYDFIICSCFVTFLGGWHSPFAFLDYTTNHLVRY